MEGSRSRPHPGPDAPLTLDPGTSRVAPKPSPAPAGRLRRLARGARWYLRGITGADAYERYLAHHDRSGCRRAPMSERDFWRERTDSRDANPTVRCC